MATAVVAPSVSAVPRYFEGPVGPDEIKRLSNQHDRIREFMLGHDSWLTLDEIEQTLGYPTTSISAQLRHLRKKRFGGFLVEKQRRSHGLWEYRVRAPKQSFAGVQQ